MVPKKLIVAVEGTAAMGPFWQTIVSDYLDKIIRCFCENVPTGQKPSASHVELSLVMFSTNDCLVQRSGWTKDMDLFFHWLSSIPFSGGGFNDAAVAEGLAEALMMFSSPNGHLNKNVDVERHCILVAASNPYPLPTLVYRPQFQNPENIEIGPDYCLSDAETLAKYFAQCAISLSIICPKQLPKHRGIYDAGKCDPQAGDLPVVNLKNPHYLVLISDKFTEARSSLSGLELTSLPSNQNPVEMDVTPVVPIPGPPLSDSANGFLARQPMSVGIIIPEPTTLTGPAIPDISSVPRAASQPVPSLQTFTNTGCNIHGTQMVRTGMSMNPSMMSTDDQPDPGMAPAGMINNNTVSNMALNQQTSGTTQSGQSKYVKIWEGSLTGLRRGQPVFITYLEGYKNRSDSESLAANFPRVMQIVRLIPQEYMNKRHGKADFLVFRALTLHGFFVQLKDRKLCAVVELPSQTLLLSVSDKAHRLIAMLFRGITRHHFDLEQEKTMASIDILPDEILVHILSFMPTRCCVQSSILGKRWRFLWARVPNLKFDSWDHKTARSFSNFVNRFVFIHKGQNINTFCFKHEDDHMEGTIYKFEVEKLIAIAIACNVQVIDIFSFGGFMLPQCIFKCKTLVDLTLDCYLENKVPMVRMSGTTVYLPALKKLKLKRVRYESDESLVHLLSGCPTLEELTIIKDDDSLVCVYVSSPTLTRLDLEIHFAAVDDKAFEVKLDTPTLKYLRLHDHLSRDFSAGMLASLTEADVVFGAQTEWDVICSRSVLEFVGKLNNVSFLKLTTGFMEVPDSAFSALTIAFRNLTKFELAGDWRFVTNILEISDNLEVLTIRLVDEVDDLQHWMEPKQVPVCLIYHLGTVRFDGFKCSEPEFDMVKYILRNAKVLKTIEIYVSCTHRDLKIKYEALRRISLFERASEACQIAFD